MNYFPIQLLFCSSLLAGTTSCLAQSPSATTSNAPTEALAAWLARVQPRSFPAQVAALRARLRADARRTFRNDPSQAAVCLMPMTVAQRAAWEAARRSAPDTVVHDYRLLCVVNRRLLDGPSAAAAVATAPGRKIRAIRFLTGSLATAIYGSRAASGVVLVTVANSVAN